MLLDVVGTREMPEHEVAHEPEITVANLWEISSSSTNFQDPSWALAGARLLDQWNIWNTLRDDEESKGKSSFQLKHHHRTIPGLLPRKKQYFTPPPHVLISADQRQNCWSVSGLLISAEQFWSDFQIFECIVQKYQCQDCWSVLSKPSKSQTSTTKITVDYKRLQNVRQTTKFTDRLQKTTKCRT